MGGRHPLGGRHPWVGTHPWVGMHPRDGRHPLDGRHPFDGRHPLGGRHPWDGGHPLSRHFLRIGNGPPYGYGIHCSGTPHGRLEGPGGTLLQQSPGESVVNQDILGLLWIRINTNKISTKI